jgi:hypothetical protein
MSAALEWLRKDKGGSDRYETVAAELNKMPTFYGRNVSRASLYAKMNREV